MNTHLNVDRPTAISAAEIHDLAITWYHLLDIHAPLAAFPPLLLEEGLKMTFPETTASGFAGFQRWYERVIHLFFDEVHTLKDIQCIPQPDRSQPDRSQVKVIVKWEASRWAPPAPRSERIVLDAAQTWEVVRSPITQRPVIASYSVNALHYYDGSAQL